MKRFFMIRHIALLLVILMLFGDVSVFSQSSENQAHFDRACKEYNDGRYNDAQIRLERLVDFIKNEKTEFSVRVHLLLGASIEQQGNPKVARKHYELSHALLEKPVIDGVDLTGLKQLEKSFSKKPKKWKSLDRDVIETPGVKKKKKFPVLLAVLGVAAVAAVVVLSGGGDPPRSSDPPIYSSDPGRPDYSQEVFNSIKWVLVHGGKFSMGSNDGSADERPVHTVYVDLFKISKYEITFDFYDKFCESTGRSKPSDKGWGRGNRPVINVTWHDAKAFCDWLSEKTGQTVRLPTEAEWEKAARGGNSSRRYIYSGSDSVSAVAWYLGNSGGKTHTVGTRSPNELGIRDMSGNVFEWCADWYGSGYYRQSPYRNPQGPSSGSERVLRGGSWFARSEYCRSATRYKKSPGTRDQGYGFRVVLEP